MTQSADMSKFLPSFMAFLLLALVAGCGGGGGNGGGSGIPAGAITPGAACPASSGPLIPTITASDPTNGNLVVATSSAGVAGGGKLVTVSFSLAMNAATINTTTFTLRPTGGAPLVPASVTYNASSKIATLTTASALLVSTSYTAVVTQGATSAAGTPMGCAYAWSFTTGATASTAQTAVNLGLATTFGLASRAGLSTTGVTRVNGDVALSPLASCTDATGNAGASQTCLVKTYASPTGMTVNGSIYFAGDPFDGGATAAAVSNDLAAGWTEGRNKADTQAVGALGGQLGAPGPVGKIILPGVYHEAALGMAANFVATFDAQNDSNAVFFIKVDSSFVDSGTLLLPTQIKLANGAQAANIWFITGLDATLGSGTTWNGNILAGRTVTVNDGTRVLGRVLAGASGAGALTLTGAASPSLTTVTVP